jgi:hypothetical protein
MNLGFDGPRASSVVRPEEITSVIDRPSTPPFMHILKSAVIVDGDGGPHRRRAVRRALDGTG